MTCKKFTDFVGQRVGGTTKTAMQYRSILPLAVGLNVGSIPAVDV
jgi:hypothetical protein